LKKQVHPGWEDSRLQDPTWETTEKITPDHLVKLLEEMFQNTNSWPTDEQVRSYHIRVVRDSVRCPFFNQHYDTLKYYSSHVWMQALDSLISSILRFEGDIPIPANLISARTPSGESASEPSARASAGASKT
jgi:hypothetical protein